MYAYLIYCVFRQMWPCNQKRTPFVLKDVKCIWIYCILLDISPHTKKGFIVVGLLVSSLILSLEHPQNQTFYHFCRTPDFFMGIWACPTAKFFSVFSVVQNILCMCLLTSPKINTTATQIYIYEVASISLNI